MITRPGMTLFPLRFADPELEAEFLDRYWVGALPAARFCMVSSLALWLGFGLLDRLLAGAALPAMWIIRFAVGTPIAVALLGMSFAPPAKRWMDAVMLAVVFRYGGDEFFVLLDNTTLDEARALAGRFVTSFSELLVDDSTPTAAAGVSVGVAMLDDSMTEAETLLAAADRALYEAKSRGKGRIAVAG